MMLSLANDELVSRLVCSEFLKLGVISGFLKESSLSYLGSGYEHQNCYYALKRLNFSQPFTLIVYDMHDDYMKNNYVTCGNWIYHILKEFPKCNAVVVGCTEHKAMNDGNYAIMGYKGITAKDVLAYCKQQVYESVDIDVLKEKLALSRTEWNYGQLSLDNLLDLIKGVGSLREVIGFDLCGHCTCKKLDYRTALISAIITNAYTKQADEKALLELLKNNFHGKSYKLSSIKRIK